MSCFIVVKAREPLECSFKKHIDDELIIHYFPKSSLMPIEVEPGEYICAFILKRGKKGHLKVTVPDEKVIQVIIPPYGF